MKKAAKKSARTPAATPASGPSIAIHEKGVKEFERGVGHLHRQNYTEALERFQAIDHDAEEFITTSIARPNRLWVLGKRRPKCDSERADPALDIRIDVDKECKQLAGVVLPLHTGYPRPLRPLL